MQILPNLYQVSRMGVHCFVLDSADGVILIDTGMPGNVRAISRQLEAIGKGFQDVVAILITHADIDHVGSLGKLQTLTPQATTYASALSQSHIENRTSPPHLGTPAKQITPLLQKLFQTRAQVDQVVADGDTLPLAGGIEVIAAPGHTPDNIVFYWSAEKVLFAADLLNQMGGTFKLTPDAITYDKATAKQSAAKVLAYDVRYLVFGHGDPVNVTEQAQAVAALKQSL